MTPEHSAAASFDPQDAFWSIVIPDASAPDPLAPATICPGCNRDAAGAHPAWCSVAPGPLLPPPPVPPVAPAAEPVEEGPYTLTDDGLAQRLLDEHAERLRYIPERGLWLVWDAYRWIWDEGGDIRELVKELARALPVDTGAQRGHKKYALSARGVSACLQMACTDARVKISAERLDAYPLELNTPSGIVDLLTAQVRTADPLQLHTRSTPVGPDFDMPTPRFDRFMQETFGGDARMIAFIMRLMGYSASGDTRFHVLPFLHGSGQNGKSVLVELLDLLLGDYAMAANEGFLDAGHREHPTELAKLKGLRFVIAAEVNRTSQFNEARMKQLTGGDRVTARFMHKDEFTFIPTHHLWLMGNDQPQVAAGGESFWRRMRLIPFPHRVPDELKVDDLAAIMFRDEAPGILAKIITGAVDVFAHGLGEPKTVMAATDEYADEEDHLSRFLGEAVRLGGGKLLKVETPMLRATYVKWCRNEGIREPMTPQTLGRELKRKGIASDKSNGKRYYLGMTLVHASDAMEPAWMTGPGRSSWN